MEILEAKKKYVSTSIRVSVQLVGHANMTIDAWSVVNLGMEHIFAGID